MKVFPKVCVIIEEFEKKTQFSNPSVQLSQKRHVRKQTLTTWSDKSQNYAL